MEELKTLLVKVAEHPATRQFMERVITAVLDALSDYFKAIVNQRAGAGSTGLATVA